MLTLRRKLAYGALLLGFALDIGCSPRQRPAVTPPPIAPRADSSLPDVRDDYLDLSAVARVLALPDFQQIAIWRTWAREHSTDDRQRVALSMLARRADPGDAPVIFDAFTRGTPKIRTTALRALLVFGPEVSRGGRERLWAAAQAAPASVTPELIWALVTAQDPRVYELALNAYRNGALTSVKTIDGANAFDAALIGALDLKHTLTLAQDRDPRLRLLVAQTCARVAQTECTPWLTRLVRDPVMPVSVAAAPGLVKLGSVETHDALTQALRAANQEHRARMLYALRDEAGLAGLVAALDSVSPDPALGLSQSAAILRLIQGSGESPHVALDPRAADALEQFVQQAPHAYSRTWAAITLAQLGDLRALPSLAARLRLTPTQANPGDTAFELDQRHDDADRVAIARALIDLAELYPEHLGDIRKSSEDALLGWLRSPEYWHGAALLALAKLRSPQIVPRLRTWASSNTPLPKPTDDLLVLPRHDWQRAMVSLQALGTAHDAASIALLQKSLSRRPKDLDLSIQGLSADPNHPRGIVLRLLDAGAISGLAELGDARGAEALFLFADDPLENQRNRAEACRALAWVATERDRDKILDRLRALRGARAPDARFDCLLETFAARAASDFKPALLTLLEELTQSGDVTSAFIIARALGRIGILEADESRVLPLLQREGGGALPAALALLVGARPEMAQLAALRLLGRSEAELQPLKEAYAELMNYVSAEDLHDGAIYRWVTNACAVEQAGAVMTHWPRELLGSHLTAISRQAMPHPLSSPQFRMAAYQSALEGNRAAIEALLAAGEGGALLAASETPGPSSHVAYLAYRRMLRSVAPTPAADGR